MFVKSNGANIFVEDTGNKDGIPFIFIHGFPFDHTTWDGQMRAMPARFHSIAYDLRGFGRSERGDGQYTIELFTDDLFALMDNMQMSKAIVCGLSMGGYIALRALEREPERFLGIVLCDTKATPDTDEGKLKRAAAVKLIKSEGVPAYVEGSIKGLFCKKTLKEHPEIVYKVQKIMESTHPQALCGATIAMAARTDTSAALDKINFPSLIIVGKEDGITPPDVAKAMYGRIEGADLHMIEDAGHLSNLEQEESFNIHLLKWLEEHFK